MEKKRKEIVLAGGCFWGLERYLEEIKGVEKTEVGYANGKTADPTYQEVCQLDTGHAETVKVVYDPEEITLKRLLSFYFKVIDPTSLNKQGNDIGTQYRTGIYYVDEKDRAVIIEAIQELQKEYEKPIAIEIIELDNYFKAEEYHQKYLNKHPMGYCHIGKEWFEYAKKSSDQ
ncbi:peptide-methionine (S)-S-oxide reductase MsrA [Clostridium aminobutyricum]|uniref:Peptide methionine sulfoxide reductase MsrA n=1 Tax=Clostridium aminobutyricum TaxID=33953 RepID=A0A939DA06_CLOAM|nr:peptide-methionine (S)-S-oxide reductase MsrA [Clostridium aminobutyricum]MBN7773971.1 peptide-methionine (S)-S-oxide reductase MsrA [Clostridium aminobutyricum]